MALVLLTGTPGVFNERHVEKDVEGFWVSALFKVKELYADLYKSGIENYFDVIKQHSIISHS